MNAQRQRHLPSGGTARRDGHLHILAQRSGFWRAISYFLKKNKKLNDYVSLDTVRN